MLVLYIKKQRDQRNYKRQQREKKVKEEQSRAKASVKEETTSSADEDDKKSEQKEKDTVKRDNDAVRGFLPQLTALLRITCPSLTSKSGLYIVLYTFVLCSRCSPQLRSFLSNEINLL